MSASNPTHPVVVPRIHRSADRLMTGSQLRIHRRARIGFRTRYFPMTGCLRARWIVTRAWPWPARVLRSWLASSCSYWCRGVSVAAADGDGYGVLGAGAQGSALGIVVSVRPLDRRWSISSAVWAGLVSCLG